MKKDKPKPTAVRLEFGARLAALRLLAGHRNIREGAKALDVDEGRATVNKLKRNALATAGVLFL